MKNDWNFNGIEHLERNVEIVPDVGWKLEGSINNRVVKEVSE